MQPTEVLQNVDSQAITVTGQRFSPQAEITVNSQAMPTNFVSESEMQAVLDAASVSIPGTLQIAVRNPDPDGGVSEAYALTVAPAPAQEEPEEEPQTEEQPADEA